LIVSEISDLKFEISKLKKSKATFEISKRQLEAAFAAS